MKYPLLCGLLAASLAVPGAAFAQVQAYTYGGAIVYAGPAPDYPMLAQLPDDMPVTVMGCVAGYSWCDVVVPNLRGWVYADNILYPAYQGGPVSLMGYGAAIGIPVVGFSIGNYWGRFYRSRPWYGSQNRWINHAPPRPIAPPHPRPRPPANYRQQHGARASASAGIRAPTHAGTRAPLNAGARAPAHAGAHPPANGRPQAPAIARPAPGNARLPAGHPGPRFAPRPAPERNPGVRNH